MSDDGDDGLYYDHDSGPGFEWTRPAIAAAGLMAIIAVLAIWVLWPNGDNNTPEAAGTQAGSPTASADRTPQPGGETPATEVEDPPGPAGECPTDRQTNDELPPPVAGTITWQNYLGYEVPTSSTAGPLRVEDTGLAHCYDQTPSGAVLMATNFLGRSVYSPDRVEIITAQVMPGPVRAETLARMGGVDEAPVAEGTLCPIAAYRVTEYSPSAAEVEVVLECGANDLRPTPVQLTWHEDDWKIVYPTSYQPSGQGPPDRVLSLDDFDEFGAGE